MGELIEPRALRKEERDLLEFLLSADFPGRDALAQQSTELAVVCECDCGCGTVDLRGSDSAPKASTREPIPVEAYADGVDVLLFVRGGSLRSMEIVHHGDPRHGCYPKPEGLKLWVPGAPR